MADAPEGQKEFRAQTLGLSTLVIWKGQSEDQNLENSGMILGRIGEVWFLPQGMTGHSNRLLAHGFKAARAQGTLGQCSRANGGIFEVVLSTARSWTQ